MRNLETVLNGYENVDVVPSLFVFMGNFCSRPCNLSFSSFSNLRCGTSFELCVLIVLHYFGYSSEPENQ